jgi:hypothetical protein
VTPEPPPGMEATRRAALAGVGLAGLAASVAACGTGSKSAATAGTPAGATPAQAGATGPAPSPLRPKSITVAGDSITLA